MRKFLTILAFCLITLCSFTSCSIDMNQYPPYSYVVGWIWQPDVQYGNGQYAIGGYTNGQTRAALTRAEIPGGTYTDFALYSWTEDSVVMGGYHGVFQGNTWGYNEAVKYFDNDEDEYNFIGIIPSNAAQSFNPSTSEVTVESLTSFTTDDAGAQAGTQVGTYAEDREFLYALSTVQYGHYNEGATLSFNHGNTKVYLKFTSDNPNTQIVDFVPTIPEVPANPGTPDTETYTSKSVNFIDELVAGNAVQVPIGFVGSSSPKLTATNPTSLYIGTNNATYNYYAKDWLLSIKDAVNAQFEYYRLDAVASSTSKIQVDDEDWESKTSNKKLYMMKLAAGVNAADFAAGNDAFWTALCAHETDWVGGSPAASFKSMFQKAYDEGWRVIRINTNVAYKTFPTDMTVESTNANEVYVFLANNSLTTVQVCEITPGTPATPGTPEVPGIDGIVMIPATSTNNTGTDAVLSTYPATVNATVGLNGVTYEQQTAANEVVYTIPATPQEFTSATTRVASPTTWYTFPVIANAVSNVGYTIKFSYTYDGTLTKYDNRVFLPASECQWEEGKYYTYIINIRGKGNGKTDPVDADSDDPVVPQTNEITVTSVIVDYTSGEEHEHTIK